MKFRRGPFLSAVIVGALADLTGSQGWGPALVGGAAGCVWAVAQVAEERTHR